VTAAGLRWRNGGVTDARLSSDHFLGGAFFQVQLHDPEPFLKRTSHNFLRSPSVGMRFCSSLLADSHPYDISPSLKCQPVSAYFLSHELVASTTEETPVATATTTANPQFGHGGAQQFFIPSRGNRQPVLSIPLKRP
jgi:hypothetical protein